MKRNKIALALILIFSLSSCAQFDNWLVKKTGLRADQFISIGISVKNKTESTIEEVKAAQKQNKASGKEVIEIQPVVVEENKEYSIFGEIPYLQALLSLF